MRLESPLWQCVVVFGGIVGLSYLGLAKRAEFEHEARRRGCVSNQRTLGKAVDVLESQSKLLPADRELFIEVRTDGRIARASAEIAALAPNGTALFDLIKDEWVFMCPTRYSELLDHLRASSFREVRGKVVETHYRWVSSPRPRPELGGRKRGVYCVLHGQLGERDRPGLEHGGVDRR